MSEAKNHHWFPQFLMRPWVGSDGLVESFYRPYDQVSSSRKSPKSLGAENHLYTAKWPGFTDPVFVERALQKIEDAAAKVRDRILAGQVGSLTIPDRENFATAITLLLVRRPEHIHSKRAAADQFWRSEMDETFSTALMSGRTSAEQVEHFKSGYGEDLIFNAMLDVALTYAKKWLRLSWRVFDVSVGGIDLVLGDKPLRIWGDHGRITELTMPLSPKVFFVAGYGLPHQEVELEQEKFRQFIAINSIAEQFQQAERFVIARDKGCNEALVRIANRNSSLKPVSRNAPTA